MEVLKLIRAILKHIGVNKGCPEAILVMYSIVIV